MHVVAETNATWASPAPKGADENSLETATTSAGDLTAEALEPRQVGDNGQASADNSEAGLLGTILDNWPAALQAVRAQSKNVEALLRGCAATGLEGATVILACDGDFHARELQKPENKRLVESAISQVAGRPCYVKCVVRDKKTDTAKLPPLGQPDATKPDDDDPLVRAALRMLNARVLESN